MEEIKVTGGKLIAKLKELLPKHREEMKALAEKTRDDLNIEFGRLQIEQAQRDGPQGQAGQQGQRRHHEIRRLGHVTLRRGLHLPVQGQRRHVVLLEPPAEPARPADNQPAPLHGLRPLRARLPGIRLDTLAWGEAR